LTREERQAAWKRVEETAPEGKITQRHVQETVQELYPKYARQPLLPKQKTSETRLSVPSDGWDDTRDDTLWKIAQMMERVPTVWHDWTPERRCEWLEKFTTHQERLATFMLQLQELAKHKMVILGGQ
jgi:hypothetical protein